jgi:hypothetical protein
MPETKTTETSNQTVQNTPSNLQNEAWGGLWGSFAGNMWPGGNQSEAPQWNQPVNAPTPQATQDWYSMVGNMKPPDYSGNMGINSDYANQANNRLWDVGGINMNANYKDTQFAVNPLQFNDPFAGYNGGGPGMQVQAGMMPTGADAYRTSVDQVHKPGDVGFERIGNMPQITGPNLQNYQMGQAERVTAPGGLNSFQLNAPERVATPDKVASQSFTQPGTAQQFMSPYQQNVLDVQKDRAVQDYQQQLTDTHSQAAKAGAFGGSRQAVQDATMNRDLQDRMAQIQATGTQQAFEQAQQQFNQEQGLGMQGQQFNAQTGMQAGLANQQAGMQTSLANQQAALQAQGLGTTTGLQAALANQQAGLTVGGQNLQALLQTQGLGAQLGQSAQMANQQMAYNQALANQQAGMQTGMFNAGQDLSAQQMNQGANLQAGLAANQLGFQAGSQNAQLGLQAQGMNQQAQQAQLQRQYGAMGQQGNWGMQGGINTQNLGMEAQKNQMVNNQMGANFNLQAQEAQQQARQQAQNSNLNYLQFGAGMNQANAGLMTQGWQNQMGQAGLAQNAGQFAQNTAQSQQDRAYADWLRQVNYPMQMIGFGADLASKFPQQGSTTQHTEGSQTQNTPGPSIWNTVAGMVGTAAGAALGTKIGRMAEGGLMDDSEPAYAEGGIYSYA